MFPKILNGIILRAGELLSDIPETIGNLIHESTIHFSSLTGFTHSSFLSWTGEIFSQILGISAVVVKGTFNILNALLHIVIHFLSLNFFQLKKSCHDLLATTSGMILLLSGKVISLLQRTILIQTGGRKLTEKEMGVLIPVFRNSISFYNIRIVHGNLGILGIANSAFVLGNTIFLPGKNFAYSDGLLIHECVHIWQYQNHGCSYAFDSLWAQYRLGRISNTNSAYDWRAEISRGKRKWEELNPEAQAQLIEEASTTTHDIHTQSHSSEYHSLFDSSFRALQNCRSFRISSTLGTG